MPRVLVVDDEPEILETTRWAFEMAGFEVETAATAEEALPRVRAVRPQAFLIDYKLPGASGLEVLRAAKAEAPQAVAVMITGLTHESEAIEGEARALGADEFLLKPLEMEAVVRIVRERVRPSTSSGRTEAS